MFILTLRTFPCAEIHQREAVYIALGIKPNGNKKIIGYRIAPVENIEVWSEMIADFKERGLEQVELFLPDGFVGIKDIITQSQNSNVVWFTSCAISAKKSVWPIVLRFWMPLNKSISKLNRKETEAVLHAFYEAYGSKYSRMIKDLQKLEEDMLVFYQYPKQIRPSIYSTNMIESINRMIKRKNKPKLNSRARQL